MKRARYQTGSVVFDKRRGTWALLWRENGKRRSKLIGTKAEYPTKAAASRAAERMKSDLVAQLRQPLVTTVEVLVDRYRAERMPARHSTRLGYDSYLKNWVVPEWGEKLITELQPRVVELWLNGLDMKPKSKGHIRGLLGTLITFAMWRGDIPTGVNPMSLVRLHGTNRPANPRRTITAEEFQTFSRRLSEPFCTIAFLCVCLGLRISECLGLQWRDVDWLNGRLSVKRGIVRQVVDDTKTPESQKNIPMSAELVEMLARWKQTSQFGEPTDWVFASPVQLGTLPWSYPNVWRVFKQAATHAETGRGIL